MGGVTDTDLANIIQAAVDFAGEPTPGGSGEVVEVCDDDGLVRIVTEGMVVLVCP